jgi:hypothetical protein
MIECLDCGAHEPEGTLFCSECGRSLLDMPAQPTNVLPFSKPARRSLPYSADEYKLVPRSEPLTVTFVIPGTRHHLTVELTDHVLVGRADAGEDVSPDLDLTEHEGMEKGVSREHAALHMSEKGIVLFDLDSTNGTMLNNNRLPPEQPFLLKSGDEVRFGDLLVHVFFDL